MAEWITQAQVRKRFQDHFCESLYDHPELVTPDTVVEYKKNERYHERRKRYSTFIM